MVFFSLSFLLGDWLLHQSANLPHFFMMLFLMLLAFCVLRIKISPVLKTVLIGCIIGFLYGAAYALFFLHYRIPHEIEGKPLLVSGYIISIPYHSHDTQSFLFHPTKMMLGNQSLPYLSNMMLYFKTNDLLHVGDHWEFFVRLKRIHGLQNPGGMDYEAYALQNKVFATGSVLTKKVVRKIGSYPAYAPLAFLRQRLFQHLLDQLPVSSVRHWMIALIMGERYQIPIQHWEVLRRTGTNHLMAIAGLHIGIVAGLIYAIVCFCVRRLPMLISRVPDQLLASSSACLIGILYAALAGFSIPTQRAALMLAIATGYVLRRKTVLSWSMLAQALLIVLLVNPSVVLNDSFWLSFGTIALIFYCMGGRLAPIGFWWQHGRIQWVIGIGLIPLSLFFFGECSLMSFVANTIAIPWLTFLLLPWLLLGTVFSFMLPLLSHYVFLYCDWSLSGLWAVLTFLSRLPISSIENPINNHYVFLTSCVAFLMFLLPKGMAGRALGVIWLLPLLTYSAKTPAPHEAWVTLLDVGQGLSVLVRTQHHVLLYDAGPRLASHDAGQSVILPYLKYHHLKSIDLMMISHGDNDHIGGAKSVYDALSVNTIKTSVPDKMKDVNATLCVQGDAWEWDGVRFSVLYPSRSDLQLGNDSSCVLMVDTGTHRLLLTGDIEAYAEDALLQAAIPLKADVMIAPHHGSKTSSTDAFIRQVAPHYVFYAVGYRNRYRFPHASVTARYEENHAIPFATDKEGAIDMILSPKKEISIHRYRVSHKRYWHDV